jgi:hypothetical protein
MDGLISCWGLNADTTGVVPDGKYTAVAVASNAVLTINSDGVFNCYSNFGQLCSAYTALGANGRSGAIGVYGYSYESYVLWSDGTATCTGGWNYRDCQPPSFQVKSMAVQGGVTCGYAFNGMSYLPFCQIGGVATTQKLILVTWRI